jgi:hypothetical protein
MLKRCTAAGRASRVGRSVATPMYPAAASSSAPAARRRPPAVERHAAGRPARRAQGRGGERGVGEGGAKSAALAKRSAGSLSSAWSTAASTWAGRSGAAP